LNKIINSNTTCIETYSKPKELDRKLEDLISNGIEPVLLIVDYQMPEMNGDELILNVKKKYPTIPCVMLSGQANKLAINRLKEDKLLSEFIEKPWKENQLVYYCITVVMSRGHFVLFNDQFIILLFFRCFATIHVKIGFPIKQSFFSTFAFNGS
jgi:FixJ family two-component response regulator